MKKVTIIYGSTSGNTQNVAKMIANKIQYINPKAKDVKEVTSADLQEADVLILGTSTWGYGDIQDDWENYLPELEKSNLEGKTIAIFGLGDSDSYSDTFVNGMAAIYNTIKNMKCTIVGEVSTDDYTFDDSESVIDGNFIGLALNEDGESDKTEERITNWLETIKKYL